MWGAWRLVLEDRYLYTFIGLPGATPCPWPNPPFFTFVTAPLGLLDVRSAAYVWFYLKLALLVFLILRLRRLQQGLSKSSRAWVSAVLLSVCWFNYDFTLGHMNLVANSLTLLSLLAYLEDRMLPAALTASLSICAKGPAGLLLLFFAARRRVRLFVATASFCLLWTILPALVWGPAKTYRYTRDFVDSIRFGTIYSDVEVGWAENWSLPALVMRVLGQARPGNHYGRTLELVSWSPEAAETTSLALSGLGLLALGAWWYLRREGKLCDFLSPRLHHAAIAATATLVFSPATRKAYLGTLLLPYFVLVGYLGCTRRGRRSVGFLFVSSIVLSYMTHGDLWGKAIAGFFERWHAVTFALFALLAAQVMAALYAEKAEREVGAGEVLGPGVGSPPA